MGSVYLRGKTWWIQYYRNGKPYQESSKSKKKTDTKTISYNLYKEGKTIDEIALERSLNARTIEGHLAHFIAEGKLKLEEFMVQERIDEIIYAIDKLDAEKLSPVKKELGDDFSYSEIKFVMAFHKGIYQTN